MFTPSVFPRFCLSFYLWACLSLLGFTACNKEADRLLAEEEIKIQVWGRNQGYDLVRHESGLYYQIIQAGFLNQRPVRARGSFVEVLYWGYLLEGGQVFAEHRDQSQILRLSDLIYGWQLALPLIGRGGIIRFVLPSSLAYGQVGMPPEIPPNSILVFELELVENHPHF